MIEDELNFSYKGIHTFPRVGYGKIVALSTFKKILLNAIIQTRKKYLNCHLLYMDKK